MVISFLYLQEDLEQDNGHFSVLDLRKSGFSISEDSPQGEWDKMAEKMMLTFAESGHPVFRASSPLSRGQLKSKGSEKCRYTIVPIWKRLKLFFAQLLL